MKLVQGSYVILKLQAKPELARCTSVDGNSFKGVLEKEKEKDEKSPPVIKFEREDVMAVLGKRPRAGSVYGLKVEPLVRREYVKGWGDIRIYNYFDDAQFNLLTEALNDSYTELQRLRVTKQFKFELEVRQPQGKYAGWYKHRPKVDTDLMCIKPDINMEGLEYIIFHEYAHGIWFRMFTPKMRNAWVRLYHEYVKLQQVKDRELKDILGEIESAGSVRGFMREADDETKLVIKQVLKHIINVHGLNVSHLELALETDGTIEEYWPTALEVSEKEISITDYARKSPEEFFAEAVAHKFSKRKLPKKIEELYEKHMTRLTKNTSEVATERVTAKKKKTDKAEKEVVLAKKKKANGGRSLSLK